jgi:hypothetical protein
MNGLFISRNAFSRKCCRSTKGKDCHLFAAIAENIENMEPQVCVLLFLDSSGIFRRRGQDRCLVEIVNVQTVFTSAREPASVGALSNTPEPVY